MPEEPPVSPASSSAPNPEPAERLTPGRIVSRFLLIPILVITVCVGIFLMFALLSHEPAEPYDYLHEIKEHHGERRWEAALGLSRLFENPRWQAAYGLSKQIARDPGAAGRDDRLVREMITVFEEAEGQDPRIRRYLALALGRLGNSTASAALISGLEDEDATTQIYCMGALGTLGEQQAVEPVRMLLEHQDAGVRKMAAYTLGALGDKDTVEALVGALEDPVRDVGWNAAIALARLGDRRGVPMLLRMLEPGFLNSVEGMSDLQKQQASIEAIRALAELREPSSLETLRSLRSSARDLKVRQSAIEALETLETR
ncbi:MAG: HEAT repeat domain-containing protein [Acidobacteriota bacterium]